MSMFKSARVSYPKRRKRTDELTINEVQEPIRKTMYDVTMENLRALKRVTYLHRVFYVGEHFFDKEDAQFEQLFRDIIEGVNEGYTSEKLSGFLLCYKQCFIHMVEGDEDSINKHLKLLHKHKKRNTHVGTIKLLIHVSNISRRLTKQWVTYFGVPSQYLGKINIESSLEESARHIYNCIRKMYNLIFAYNQDQLMKGDQPYGSMETDTDVAEETQLDSSFARKMRSEIKASTLGVRTVGYFAHTSPMDRYRNTLPEHEIVDFSIKTNFTQSIESYCDTFGFVPQGIIYKDRVWPYPMNNLPFDVFGKPFDTITELPKFVKQESENPADNEERGEIAAEGNSGK